MKKGIIAVSLLLSGALLITPITNALSKSDEKETTVKPVKIEQNVQSEKIESTDKLFNLYLTSAIKSEFVIFFI